MVYFDLEEDEQLFEDVRLFERMGLRHFLDSLTESFGDTNKREEYLLHVISLAESRFNLFDRQGISIGVSPLKQYEELCRTRRMNFIDQG